MIKFWERKPLHIVEKGSFFPLITSLQAYLIKQTCEVNISWTSIHRHCRNDAMTKTCPWSFFTFHVSRFVYDSHLKLFYVSHFTFHHSEIVSHKPYGWISNRKTWNVKFHIYFILRFRYTKSGSKHHNITRIIKCK